MLWNKWYGCCGQISHTCVSGLIPWWPTVISTLHRHSVENKVSICAIYRANATASLSCAIFWVCLCFSYSLNRSMASWKHRNVRKSISRLVPIALSVFQLVLSYNCISVFLVWIIQEAIQTPLFNEYIRPPLSHEAAKGEREFFIPRDIIFFVTRFITSIWQVGSWDTKTLNDLAKVIQEIWDGTPNIWLLLVSKPALKPLDIVLNFQSFLALLPTFWANSSTTLYLFFPPFVNKANLAR